MIIDFPRIYRARFAVENSITGSRNGIGNIQAMRQVIHRTRGNDAQNALCANQPVSDRVNRAIASRRDDQFRSLVGSAPRYALAAIFESRMQYPRFDATLT